MGHWYQQDGQPLYTVPKADGKGERDTTLRDAKKLGLVPSVTSILGIVDKPALTRWKQDQLFDAIMSYLPSSSMCIEDIEEYKRIIFRMSEKKGKDAAERGNEVHNALEYYYIHGELEKSAYEHRLEDVYNADAELIMRIKQPSMADYCLPVTELISYTFGKMCNWNAEHSFFHKDGFGGKCDLHMLPCYEFPNGVILDFKTKSASDFSKVKAYPEQCMQLVAYREGFNLPKAECYNLFISTQAPGQLLLHKWTEEENQVAWKKFGHLVSYWLLENKLELSLDK